MCGIIGVLSTNENSEVQEKILAGLDMLQKRGYDSAGICVVKNTELSLFKFSSSGNMCGFEKLQKSLSEDCGENYRGISRLGIGHTRWATHGENVDRNSQPHLSYDGRFCIVHNGIISNFRTLRENLEDQGVNFRSDTDSEIICNLLAYNANCHTDKDVEWCLKKTTDCLIGNYAILVIDSRHPESLICLTNGPPLLGGFSEDIFTVVSENSAFDDSVSEYFVLKNNEIITIKSSGSQIIFDKKTEYEFTSRRNVSFESSPYPYKHWTIKEIYEQELSVSRLINNYVEKNNINIKSLDPFKGFISDIKNIIFVGCGTSYNACLFGKYVSANLGLFNTIQVIDGSDLVTSDIPYLGKTVMFLVSQSGETKDVYRCIDIARSRNVMTVAVVNEVESVIARNSECVIDILAGKENGVASTKTYTNQAVTLSMVIMYMSTLFRKFDKEGYLDYIKDLKNLTQDIRRTFELAEGRIPQVLGLFEKNKNNFVLGRKGAEGVAKEASLKIKEITYIHSEGVSTSSLKHGSFAVLDSGTPVIILSDSFQDDFDCNLSTCHELNARSVPVLWISDYGMEEMGKTVQIVVPPNRTFTDLLCIVPVQLLSYHISLKRDLNCDRPRNLAKICTVD